jgi:hypothetical protein
VITPAPIAKVMPNSVVYRIEPDRQVRIAPVHFYDPDKNSTR